MEKVVMAFYYPWYWTKMQSGYWNMWNYGGHHNPDIFTSNNRYDISCPHYPSDGLYDSNDPVTIRKHFEMANGAGIDAFIVSWWGEGNILNTPFMQILDYAAHTETRITIYYETMPSVEFKHEITALDLIVFINKYGHHPGFLRVDSKPVIFFYDRVIKQHSISQWESIISTIKNECDIIMVADSMDRDIIQLFDGAHIYNTFSTFLRRKSIQLVMKDLSAACKSNQKMVGLTVLPGFDDTLSGNRRSLKKRIGSYLLHQKKEVTFERNDGKTYSDHWEWAIKENPDWILICSFNEWIEGTEIEPSIEFGDQYLELTKKYSALFKQNSK